MEEIFFQFGMIHFGLSDQLAKLSPKDMIVLSKWIDRYVTVNQKFRRFIGKVNSYKASSILELIRQFSPFISLVLEENSHFYFFWFSQLRPKKINLILLNATEILSRKGLDFKFFWWRICRSIMERASWNMNSNQEARKVGHFDGASLEYPSCSGRLNAGILKLQSLSLASCPIGYMA